MTALAIIAAVAAAALYGCFAVKLALTLGGLFQTRFWDFTIYIVTLTVLAVLPFAVFMQVSE